MTALTYLEFDLAFLIARSGVTARVGARRLNGIENTVAALARRWRVDVPLDPATELRMSEATRQQLLAWVAADTKKAEDLAAQLISYTSGLVGDASVPAGWIRLCLNGVPL